MRTGGNSPHHARNQRARVARLKAAGLCIQCGEPRAPGRLLCPPHLKVSTDYSHARYRELRRKRMCVDCAVKLPEGWDKMRCHADLVARRQQTRDKRANAGAR